MTSEREIDAKRREAVRRIVAGRRLSWDCELAAELLQHDPHSPEAALLRAWAQRKRAKAEARKPRPAGFARSREPNHVQ